MKKCSSVLILLVAFAAQAQAVSANKEKSNRHPQGLLDSVTNKIPNPFASKPIKDEALLAFEDKAFTQAQFNTMALGANDDYFRDMDYGITEPANQESTFKGLSPFLPGVNKAQMNEAVVRGRNNWIVWTGGNDRMWDYLSKSSMGSLDFLKVMSSYTKDPARYPYKRSNRWETLGVVNEPCFEEPKGPQADRWGLYLDVRTAGCGADPFADPAKYPGVKIGARGKTLNFKGQKKVFEVGSFYGYPTGIVGLRLFPNPEFDQKAADRWDAERYYNDPSYYMDPELIRPYRVGMACAFCHVGPSPVNPPIDFNNPGWKNLTGNVGAQYFWFDRVFSWNYNQSQDSFVQQLLNTARPGSLDTSLISSDQINNSRTMNAVYDLPARAVLAKMLGHWENLKGGELNNKQLNDFRIVDQKSVLRSFFDKSKSGVLAPRILKDGADSVGVLGALNRVYVNIGLFSEYWFANFLPLVGGNKITPFKIEYAAKNSMYWQANVQQTQNLAVYLMAASRKDPLAAAPLGPTYLKDLESEQVIHGKKLFAQNCAACHSSKLPQSAYQVFSDPKNPNKCVGANYADCWQAYSKLVSTEQFKKEMQDIVLRKDFLTDNYLSTDLRVPINVVDSQLCSPIATNAIRDNIWDNFSSDSYKSMNSVGRFRVNYPTSMKKNSQGLIDLESEEIIVPAGGRGYLRPPSLVSLWSTAPFLQNNSVGKFDGRGTIEGRMQSFEDSINKMLNPDNRIKDLPYGQVPVTFTSTKGDRRFGVMDVTTAESYLKIPLKFVPFLIQSSLKDLIAENGGELKLDGDSFTVHIVDAGKKFVSIKDLWMKNPKREIAGLFFDSSEKPKEATYLKIGPFPKGTPVNLISNLDLTYAGIDLGYLEPDALAAQVRLVDAIAKLSLATAKIQTQRLVSKLSDEDALSIFMEMTADSLVKASKCNDFVVNRGHYFGTKYSSSQLSDSDRKNLIEFLKHF